MSRWYYVRMYLLIGVLIAAALILLAVIYLPMGAAGPIGNRWA